MCDLLLGLWYPTRLLGLSKMGVLGGWRGGLLVLLSLAGRPTQLARHGRLGLCHGLLLLLLHQLLLVDGCLAGGGDSRCSL